MKKATLFILSIFATLLSFAQWTPSIGLSLGITPTNNIVGTDTTQINTLSIAPLFTIRNKSGWGITYSPNFLTSGAKPGLFMQTIKAGVEQYDKKILDYAANYSHYFFTGNKSVPYSPLNNEISASINSKKKWLHPFIEAGVGFGKDTSNRASTTVYDVAASIGVGHPFSWEIDSTSNITFNPSLVLNAGTSNYFSFLSVSKYIGHGKKGANYVKNGKKNGRNSGNSGTATSNSTFSINNIETRFESSFEIGSFALRPSASLFIPIGRFSDTGVFGYWQVTATYNF
jgi:hypothetical protein